MKKRELKISLSILLFLTVITMPLLNFYPNFIHDTDFDHVILKESNSPPPEQIWNKTWGGIDNDFGRDVVLDKTGNIYIVGDSESY